MIAPVRRAPPSRGAPAGPFRLFELAVSASHPSPPTDDLALLLATLPEDLQQAIVSRGSTDELLEVVMDLGRPPEARYPGRAVELAERPIGADDLAQVLARVGLFGRDNRAGIERTLHRISALRNRAGAIIGLTCRIGRAVVGTLDIVRDTIEGGHSVLLLGRPGVGKTTLLREAARVLADELGKRVIVVDTSNEIAGDGDVPHPGIGRARRLQVAAPEQQHAVMIEAVENHMPEVIVIDEIGTQAEALAARTIAERGVQLIGTAHGNTLANLLQNPTLNELLGGIQSVTLSDDEARRRGTQKAVLERRAPPTFDVLVEIQSRDAFAVHRDLAEVVDRALRGLPPRPEIRTRTPDGGVAIAPGEAGPDGDEEAAVAAAGHLPRRDSPGPARRRTLRLLPYAISRPRLERAIRQLRANARLVESVHEADLVVTLKSQEKRLPRPLRERPLHLLRSATIAQVEGFLRDACDLPDGLADQQAALREVDHAAHRVLDSGAAVELAPQRAYVRHLQHEAAQRLGLSSASRGEEPLRRVVILPG
ncbi:MAG: AAA family ATPase [Holophagales bacterium]|nr:MAG: AAA family ATPase [Holophagales bacterium]